MCVAFRTIDELWESTVVLLNFDENDGFFDHTSVIGFLEVFTGVHEPNIGEWRRTVCGDLTRCFDFTNHHAKVPNLPHTQSLVRIADEKKSLPPGGGAGRRFTAQAQARVRLATRL